MQNIIKLIDEHMAFILDEENVYRNLLEDIFESVFWLYW